MASALGVSFRMKIRPTTCQFILEKAGPPPGAHGGLLRGGFVMNTPLAGPVPVAGTYHCNRAVHKSQKSQNSYQQVSLQNHPVH